LALLCLPLFVSGAAPQVAAQTSQSTPAWYMVDQFDGELWAIGLDGSGNGWVAARETKALGETRMYQLQGGKLVRSNFAFPKVLVNSIALSSDGKEGWAAGYDEGLSRGALLHYSGGRWTKTADPVLDAIDEYAPDQTLGELNLDATARNGWATGMTAEEVFPALIQLVDGKWRDMTSTVPDGAMFYRLAADPTLKHVWAASLGVESTDATLYRLQGSRWVPVGKPLGQYFIFDLAVDSNGNGWAGLERGFDETGSSSNSPPATGFVRFRADGSWTMVESESLAAAANDELLFSTVKLDAAGSGWAVGYQVGVGAGEPAAVLIRLQGDKIVGHQYPLDNELVGPLYQQPIFARPLDLALGPNGTTWALTFEGILLRYGGLPQGGALPAPAVGFDGEEQCHKETGSCLRGPFLSYWRANGGVTQFGLPVTDEVVERLSDGKIYVVQYTERARFEYHPENKDPKYQVLLGLLGNVLAQGREKEQPFQRANQTESLYYKETGHNMSGAIAAYWQKNGGLPVFGFPISEPFREKSQTDGKEYLVQYFERNRLEYHPEQRDPNFQVLLGLLGVQQYVRTYGAQP
jgi:hypothetical protein